MPSSGEFARIYEQEKQSQEDYNKEFLPKYSSEAGELGAGLVGLASMARSAYKNIPKAVSKAKSLVGILPQVDDAIEVAAEGRKGGAKILREMTGALPDRIEKAILERTAKIRNMLTNPGAESNVYDSVTNLRSNLDQTEGILFDSLKQFRQAIGKNNKDSFDTSPILKMFSDFRKNSSLNRGVSVLDQKDTSTIARFENMLMNPKGKTGKPSNEVTVGDVVKIMDELDNKLQPYYQGKDSSPVMRHLIEVRRELDSGLAGLYPSYKETKTLFDGFVNDASLIKRKIDSTGAESFLSNIFGQNKTELQGQVESTLNLAEETVKSLGKLSPEVNTSSLSPKTESSVQAAITKIKENAAKIKSPKAQEFLDDLADKLAARRLKNFTDKDADEVNRLVQAYVTPRVKIAENAGTAIAGFLGNKMGGPVAGGVAALVGRGLSGGIADIASTAMAKNRYNIVNVLKRIENANNATPGLKKLAVDALKISEKLGEEGLVKFLEAIPVDRKTLNEIARFSAAANQLAPSKEND